MEQLTTPEMKTGDSAFPGENWFFYWKSSSSLWESKLQNYSGTSPIFAPIYWGLHSEYSDQFDFGDSRPETDLKRLYTAAKSAGKEIIFVLPLTPAPFLVNGGIPSYLARTAAKNSDHMSLACFDNAETLNRIYSFYDPNIFKNFRKFIRELNHYLSLSGISAPVFGMNALRMEKGRLKSYFEDDSIVFEKGFNRYVKQLQESEPKKIEKLIQDHSYENELKKDYYELVKGLYVEAAKECLSGSFSGILDISFLGGDVDDLFVRSSSSWNRESIYFQPLLNSLVKNICPSSVLLKHEDKKGALGKILKDVSGQEFIQSYLDHDYYNENSQSLRSLSYFEFISSTKESDVVERLMETSGLSFFLDREYPWMFKISELKSDSIEDMELEKIFFFFGEQLSSINFNKMLKLFMSGGRVFLDIASLGPNLEKKLEIFFTENNLKIESINYVSPVRRVSLGEGSLITFDSRKLSESSLAKRSSFWDSMISFLKLKHLKVNTDDELYFFWKSRGSNTYELSYEEVRRVSFYNPTSYKKKAHIPASQNFAYIKNVDLKNVEVKSTPVGLDLHFLPGGSVSLDYGYYE